MLLFLFLTSIVLLFTPIHVHIIRQESQRAPYNYILQSPTSKRLEKEQNTLLTLSPSPFRSADTNYSTAITRLPFRTHLPTTNSVVVRSEHTSESDGSSDHDGDGRRNFNNFVPSSTPADFTSSSLSSSSSSATAAALLPGTREVSFSSSFSNSDKELRKDKMYKAKRSSLLPQPTITSERSTSTGEKVSSQESLDVFLRLNRNYTPKEIAEYIIATGDEKGIIQIIADMIRDGQVMASRDDIILFLETVQSEIGKMKGLNQEGSQAKPLPSK